MNDRIVIEFRGTLAPAKIPLSELPHDEGIIDHGDGTLSVPAGSPRLRPYAIISAGKQSKESTA